MTIWLISGPPLGKTSISKENNIFSLLGPNLNMTGLNGRKSTADHTQNIKHLVEGFPYNRTLSGEDEVNYFVLFSSQEGSRRSPGTRNGIRNRYFLRLSDNILLRLMRAFLYTLCWCVWWRRRRIRCCDPSSVLQVSSNIASQNVNKQATPPPTHSSQVSLRL